MTILRWYMSSVQRYSYIPLCWLVDRGPNWLVSYENPYGIRLCIYIYSALIHNEGIHPWLHAPISWTMAFNSNQNPYDYVWPSVTPSSRWRPPYLFFVPAPPWHEPPPLFTRGWWRYFQAGSMVVITLVVPLINLESSHFIRKAWWNEVSCCLKCLSVMSTIHFQNLQTKSVL